MNNNMLIAFQNFMKNPMQYMAGMGIPQGMNNPDQIIQHLMDTGRITQAQYNQAKQMAGRFQHLQG